MWPFIFPDLWKNSINFCKVSAEEPYHQVLLPLVFCFQGHQDEVFVLEAHPTDPHILLSAGDWFFLLSPYFTKV